MRWKSCDKSFDVKDRLFNMTQVWDKEDIWVPDRNQTHDLPNTLPSSKIHHLHSLITTHDEFDSADPSGMQGAFHTDELSYMTLISMRSRRSVACAHHVLGRSWVQFLSGTRIFSLVVSCWIYLSHFITKLKIHHLYSLIKSFDFTM